MLASHDPGFRLFRDYYQQVTTLEEACSLRQGQLIAYVPPLGAPRQKVPFSKELVPSSFIAPSFISYISFCLCGDRSGVISYDWSVSSCPIMIPFVRLISPGNDFFPLEFRPELERRFLQRIVDREGQLPPQ